MARQQPTRVPAAVLPPCRMTLAPGGSVLARYTDRLIRARDAHCLCQGFGSIENLLCGEDAEDLVLRFGGQDVGRQVRGNPARAASQQDRQAMARLVAAPGGLPSLLPVRLHLKPAGLAPVPRRLPPATASWPPSGWCPLASGRREGSSQAGANHCRAPRGSPASRRSNRSTNCETRVRCEIPRRISNRESLPPGAVALAGSPRLVRSGNSAPTDAVPTPPSDTSMNLSLRARSTSDGTPCAVSTGTGGTRRSQPPPGSRQQPRLRQSTRDPHSAPGVDLAETPAQAPRRCSPAKFFPPSPEPLQAGTAKKAA